MGIEFNQNEIDRDHYIGKTYMDQKKNKVRSIIVKFRSWKSKTAFYKARPRNYLDRKKKPSSSFNVSLDLTKRCCNLLIKAKGLIANNPSIAYAFSNYNFSLVLKFNDNTYRYFNSESELNNLLNPEFKRNYLFLLRKIPHYPHVVLINHY